MITIVSTNGSKFHVYTYENFDKVVHDWGLNGFETSDLKKDGWVRLIGGGVLYLR